MPLPGVVTLVGVFATVAVLAIYLITIAGILKHVNFTLGTIIAGVRAIANQCQPLAGVMGEITGDLREVERAVKDLVQRASGAVPARRAPASTPPAPPTMVEEEPVPEEEFVPAAVPAGPVPDEEEPAPAPRRRKPAAAAKAAATGAKKKAGGAKKAVKRTAKRATQRGAR